MSTRNSKVNRDAALQAIFDKPYYIDKPSHGIITTNPAVRRSKRQRAMFGANKKSGKQKLPIVPRRRLGKSTKTSLFRYMV
ncbi:MAG: hypothetical protein WCK60_03240 [Candidatus Nomurabacteria bacterium]